MFDPNGDSSPAPSVPGATLSQNNPNPPEPSSSLPTNLPDSTATVVPQQPSWVVPSPLDGSGVEPLPVQEKPLTVSDAAQVASPDSLGVAIDAPLTGETPDSSVEEERVISSPPTLDKLADTAVEVSKLSSEETLKKASFDVTILYLDYRQKLALSGEANTAQWEEVAKAYPDFAGKIQELAATLREVEKVKKEAYPETDQILQKVSFHNVEDEASRMLLTDFLWRRATNQSGKFDKEMSFAKEAVSILRELGVSEEKLRSKVDLSPVQILEEVLKGKLRLSKIQ
ncbi:MAG: hypothetical protein Q8P13_02145 [bacterium]|nr:hypothetical protein [bacterium]